MKSIIEKTKKLFGRKKEEKPFQGIKSHNYGMLNNFIYAIKVSWKYNKSYIAALLVSSVVLGLYNLAGVYLPKIALDLVSQNVMIKYMVLVLTAFGLIMLSLNYAGSKLTIMMEYGFDKIQYHLMGNYLNKIFATDFKNMENPEFLDLTNRAKIANYYNCGFHGYCKRLQYTTISIVQIIISGIAIAMIHPLLIVVLTVLSFLIYRLFNSTMEWDKREYRDAMQENWRKHYYLAETTRDFNYAKDIRLFGMANWIEGLWKDINTVFFKRCNTRHNKWTLCEVKLSTVRLIQNIILYTVLIYMILNKGMRIANFVLYIGMIGVFSEQMTDFFSSMVWMNMNKMQMDDYRTFIDWQEDVPDADKGEGKLTDIELDGYEFVFENVSFKYPGHDKWIIKDLNLTIKAGIKLALVGVNGAGKTTLTKLLMRLYEPTEGRILLNDIDVKMYDRRSYYKIFSPVFQNVEVFAFPIWENVSMRKQSETDMDLVKKAIEKSGMDSKISKYKKGIDTQLLKIFDSEGIDLSGGERQRLAMARALYQSRKVIVLDEPTAALDALAEDKIYQEFNHMVEGKTSIFISHRLSSTRFCDQIVLFEAGKAEEIGTHDELIKQNGKYANMYHVQAQYYQEGGKNEIA